MVRLDRQACCALIPHQPNFLESLSVASAGGVHDFDVSFRARFFWDWDFLRCRVYKALPNSVMLEALSQAAIAAFRTRSLPGLPATTYIKELRNIAPFFESRDGVLFGEFSVRGLVQSSRGLHGVIKDSVLSDEALQIMTITEAGFLLIQDER